MNKQKLPQELKTLVSWSVRLLGQAIKDQYGEPFYDLIESSRKNLSKNWSASPRRWQDDLKLMRIEQKKIKGLSSEQKKIFAHCTTCMLELINRCESSYRTCRLREANRRIHNKKDHQVALVLTAHPTEARGPEFLQIFEQISDLLEDSLSHAHKENQKKIYHLLRILLNVPLTRKEKPEVADEAKSIFSFSLRPEILSLLIQIRQEGTNVMLRTWAGGDKDGHPGVNEDTMMMSLQLSRTELIDFIGSRFTQFQTELSLMKNLKSYQKLTLGFQKVSDLINELSTLAASDGKKVATFRAKLEQYIKTYHSLTGLESQELQDVLDLIWLFPALVLPLEIREDSEVVKEALNQPKKFAIGRMLYKLAEISKGLEPKWYVRGFVLSMCESLEDIQNGILLTEKTLSQQLLPVVPLFETEKALLEGPQILQSLFTRKKSLIRLHQSRWGGRFEVMLGYSDSSKESGVFPSRLLITKAMRAIDRSIAKFNLTPVFFHGNGGSIERGGGSIQEQTQTWPKSALKIFKATVQGEMVARTFASKEIFYGHIQKISERWKTPKQAKKNTTPLIEKFSQSVQKNYQQAIENPLLLDSVQKASPYLFLSELNIGSRPSKRTSELKVGGLRAIPWILCWTQTRVLFPTWWGVGQAWKDLSAQEKNEMKKAFQESDLLATFVKVLGFSLQKVELAVWRFYLEESELSKTQVEEIFTTFAAEYDRALQFHKAISGNKKLLWHRPWLRESIKLRSPMILPLNILQVEAMKKGDMRLLRQTVTGISCGMLTTG